MALSILDCIDDPAVFGSAFRDPNSWSAWRVFLMALCGLPMSTADLALFRRCTGREQPPQGGSSEAWLVCGRRSGKSFTLALIAVYLAAFRDWRPHLGPGERGTIMVIAADRKQARVILRYIKGLLTSVPMLRPTIEAERAEALDLANRVTIEIHTASFRTTRGYTIVAALLDELAFWPTENAAEPDREVLAALRPGMATIPDAMLLCASSPYARKGELWNAYRKHHGKDSKVLVWQAATRTMNPTVPQRVIDEAMESDPASAAAEYLAQFRSDVESFVSREAVEQCVEAGVLERPPLTRVQYSAFVDPSGGSSDSMTIAIAHKEGGDTVLDAMRERRPPFSPEAVVAEFSALLKTYRVSKVTGDRYAGEWPRERFREHGIGYEPSTKSKSDIYRDCLALINSRKVSLLDHPQLIAQLVGLERRTSRGGKDSIDHAPSGHDDLANAACGALVQFTDASSAYLHGLMHNVSSGREKIPRQKRNGWDHPAILRF